MTRRALGLLMLPLLVVALGSAVAALLVPGIVLLAIAAALVLVDSRSAPGPASVQVERRSDRLFSVGAANPVTLSVRAPHTASLLLRDDAPPAMLASAQYMSLHGAGETSYTLTPRARRVCVRARARALRRTMGAGHARLHKRRTGHGAGRRRHLRGARL